jgi:hypothetical protein
MGLRPSPHNLVWCSYWGEELAWGNPRDEKNPLHCSEVKLNLPGMESFDVMLSPHVCKWNGLAWNVAGETVAFIDDMRSCGFSKENTW